MNLKPLEQVYWKSYADSLDRKDQLRSAFVYASYVGDSTMTDELLALYLNGKKTAGSSLEEAFLAANERLPQIGDYWICLNSQSEPGCILRTVRLLRNKFKDVTIEIAIAEGEGDGSLEYWRRVHSEFYTPYLNSWGLTDIEDATVLTEFFEIVYR